MFVDSTFNLDRGWCLEFFQLYKENLDVKFTINVTAGRIDDELVEAIAKKVTIFQVKSYLKIKTYFN